MAVEAEMLEIATPVSPLDTLGNFSHPVGWLVGSGPRCIAQEANHRSGSFSCSAIDARTKLGGKLGGKLVIMRLRQPRGKQMGISMKESQEESCTWFC